MIKRRLGLIILSIYLSSQVLSALGYINRNQTFAAETTKNKLNSLVAILVDDKIYNSIENELKRYAQEYIQKKYESSKALVIKLNTQEYDALEIVKLLENLYFDGEKEHGSELIGTILIGELPFPVVQYEDYFFPSIYPYVDFIDQKYLWNPENGYFTKDKENGQSEIWHGVINFQNDIEKYKHFFGKLKTYNNNPEQFADKKIWYDDFIALQNNILEENEKLYKNKLAFAEDLIYRRYTDLFFNTLQGENTKRMESLVQGLSENLKQLGSSTPEIPTQSNIPTSKTPTKLLEQKLQGVLKEYTNLISIPIQNTLNQNIAASDRWRNSADNHYQKLQLKDELILGNKTTNGILRSMNDKLERFVLAKLAGEKYAMMSVMPVEYYRNKIKKKRILGKTREIPQIDDTYKFFYFGKDAYRIREAEEASIYRGSYRNQTKLGNYSTIIEDKLNPAKTRYDKTKLRQKNFGGSYDGFATQISANKGFDVIENQKEFELYQKEKVHAKMNEKCVRRWFRLPEWTKRLGVPCQTRKWEGAGTCKPRSSNQEDRADCESFEQFGNRLRGGATSLNIDTQKMSEGIYTFSGTYTPESARKPIYNIAGSVSVNNPETEAHSFKGLSKYSSPTKIKSKEGYHKDPNDHTISLDHVEFFKQNLGDKKFHKTSDNIFSIEKPKLGKEDQQDIYTYKILSSIIKHDATRPEQIETKEIPKYHTGSIAKYYHDEIIRSLDTTVFQPADEIFNAGETKSIDFNKNIDNLVEDLQKLSGFKKQRLKEIKERESIVADRNLALEKIKEKLQTRYKKLEEGLKLLKKRYEFLIDADNFKKLQIKLVDKSTNPLNNMNENAETMINNAIAHLTGDRNLADNENQTIHEIRSNLIRRASNINDSFSDIVINSKNRLDKLRNHSDGVTEPFPQELNNRWNRMDTWFTSYNRVIVDWLFPFFQSYKEPLNNLISKGHEEENELLAINENVAGQNNTIKKIEAKIMVLEQEEEKQKNHIRGKVLNTNLLGTGKDERLFYTFSGTKNLAFYSILSGQNNKFEKQLVPLIEKKNNFLNNEIKEKISIVTSKITTKNNTIEERIQLNNKINKKVYENILLMSGNNQLIDKESDQEDNNFDTIMKQNTEYAKEGIVITTNSREKIRKLREENYHKYTGEPFTGERINTGWSFKGHRQDETKKANYFHTSMQITCLETPFKAQEEFILPIRTQHCEKAYPRRCRWWRDKKYPRNPYPYKEYQDQPSRRSDNKTAKCFTKQHTDFVDLQEEFNERKRQQDDIKSRNEIISVNGENSHKKIEEDMDENTRLGTSILEQEKQNEIEKEELSKLHVNLYNQKTYEQSLTGNHFRPLYTKTNYFILIDEIDVLISEMIFILEQDYLSRIRTTLNLIERRELKTDLPVDMYFQWYNKILGEFNTYRGVLINWLNKATTTTKKLMEVDKKLNETLAILKEWQKEENFESNIGTALGNEMIQKLELLLAQLHAKEEKEDCLTKLETLQCTLGIMDQGTCKAKEQKCNNPNEEIATTDRAIDLPMYLDKELNKAKSLLKSDPNNPLIKIKGMNITTPDRPIDSPRYVSFQGINKNELRLIYPNLFKVEAFKLNDNTLSLKSPEEFRNAIKEYFHNKVTEYNTILGQEYQAAIKANPKLLNTQQAQESFSSFPHYQKLYEVNPLATPTLEKTIRPYKLFTYEELLNAIGGEKVLNTIGELLYYQNIGISNRKISDDIAEDIRLSQESFDINKKINYIITNYLTEKNDQTLNNAHAISEFILPNYSTKGYEVGFINSNDNDYIANKENKTTQAGSTIHKQTHLPSQNTNQEGSMDIVLIDQETENECGFSYGEALLLVDINDRSSPWLDGFKCWLAEVKKKPLKLDITRNSEILKDLKDHAIGHKIIKAYDKQNNTHEDEIKVLDTPEKISGTVLENIQIANSKNRINIENGSGFLTFSTSDSNLQNEDMYLTLSSQGKNCLKIDNASTCGTPLNKTIKIGKSYELPFKLGKTTTGVFTVNVKVCKSRQKECGNKNLTFVATPGDITGLKIDIGQTTDFPSGAFIPLKIQAFDKYQNSLSRSLEPYILSADKGGFIIGGSPQKSIEISDFEYDTIIYKSDLNDKGPVHFTIRKKSDPTKTILAKNQAQLFPAKLEIKHKGKNIKELTYQLNTLPLTIKQSDNTQKLNESKLIRLEIALKNNEKLLGITSKANINIVNKTAKSYILQEGHDSKIPVLQLTSSVIFEKGKAILYLLPTNKAGQETLEISIPGLPPEKVNINFIAGEPAILDIIPEKKSVPLNSKVQGKIKLTDLRGNPILKPTPLKRTTHSPLHHTSQVLQTHEGEANFSYTLKEDEVSLLVSAEVENKKVEKSLNIQVQNQFFQKAVEQGLNIMYLNLFGTDRGNQWGYLSDKKAFGEDIISKSDKTLAITTQAIDLKKVKKTAILLGSKGKLINSDNLELNAKLLNNTIEIENTLFGTIKILDPIKNILIAGNETALTKALTTKDNALIFYNFNPNYQYQQGKILDKEKNKIGSRNNGLILQSTLESKYKLPVRSIQLKGETIGYALLPQINYGKSTAKLHNPEYSFEVAFDQGSTNKLAKALVYNNSSLQENYQGYDSIQNSDELEKYIGFRADFKNITSFAAGKTVGEATIPFGSEFLINLGDPLLQRVEKNQNIENALYNGGIEKAVYTDTQSSIQKVIDIDYNNDGLKDLLVIYQDGTIKLQKQYQDKKFKNLETLLLSAEEIKEVFVGDIDGNNYQDILIRNTKQQLRAYLNDEGKFDVDGQIACLNTNITQDQISSTPESLSGVHQLFIEDMDQDATLDIVTFDKVGDIKIFYGKGKKESHSYLSNNAFKCDNEWYNRQKKQTNLVQNIGVELNKEPVKDSSLIRRPGLKLPTDAELSAQAAAEANKTTNNLNPSLLSQLSKIDSNDESLDPNQLLSFGNHFDANAATQNTIHLYDKYKENPFKDTDLIDDGLKKNEQAFIEIKKLDESNKDKLTVYKTYTDLNQGILLNNEPVKITVTIQANENISGAMFFDTVEGPWHLLLDENQKPKTLRFEQGQAQLNTSLNNYPYYLSNINLKKGEKLIRSYEVNYSDQGNVYKIEVNDINIKDYEYQPSITKNVPKDGYLKDNLPDIVLSPIDGCVKQQSILFNTQSSTKRNYKAQNINLQELANAYAKEIENAQKAREKEQLEKTQKAQSNKDVEALPGLQEIGEVFSDEEFRSDELITARNKILAGEAIDLSNIANSIPGMAKLNTAIEKIEQNIQKFADLTCSDFSFGAAGGKAKCEGLPIPFNQAFLAPGNYHIMGCIPIEPLTRTLGKGLPVFHFPGTLPTPVGPIPIPRGQKGASDDFIRVPGGGWPSFIRIYAAPTLTGQLGIAICLSPDRIAKAIPSPFSDIGGNCIVTSIAPKCGGGESGNENEEDTTAENYQSRIDGYGKTNACTSDTKNSPFRMSGSLNTSKSQIGDSFLGGIISIDQSPSIAFDSNETGIFIGGEKIEGVKDLKNKILGGNQKGIQKILMGFLTNQIEYIKNNLLRWHIDIYLPDFKKLIQETEKIGEGIDSLSGTGLKSLLPSNLPNEVKKLFKNKEVLSKEQITKLNFAGGDNPFEKLKNLFNETKLVNISTQNIAVKIPRIYHEDIEAYRNYLKSRADNQSSILESRNQRVQSVILSCPKELASLFEKKESTNGQIAFEKKQAECQNAEHIMNKIIIITNKLQKTNDQIFKNIQTLEQYKRFPLELYEWIHASDRYMSEISGVVNSFFGYLNYWMDINAKRFSQYIDVFVTILAVIKTYQIIIDFSVNWTSKCSTCSKDTYDQYACKLSFLCQGIPLDPLPIPSIKLPNLLIDLSHIDLGLDIVLPHFTFVPESLHLPRLPNLPLPPDLGLSLDFNIDIGDLPLLPEPPQLPDLPSLLPHVKLQLPILPPAPKIPEIPNQINTILKVAEDLGKILCIVKSGIGLVGESSVKARIEQMTQRSYEVPRVDKLNLTDKLRNTPLQGLDYQIDSFVNLQYNFDGFFAFMKSTVDGINNWTQVTKEFNTITNARENGYELLEEELGKRVQQLEENMQKGIDKLEKKDNGNAELVKADLSKQLQNTIQKLHTPQEKSAFEKILALTQHNTNISANHQKYTTIRDQVQKLINDQKQSNANLATLVKKDYDNFLLTLDTHNHKNKNVEIAYTASLLAKNPIAEELFVNHNIVDEYVNFQSQQINGYLSALEKHGAEGLNMQNTTYLKSKNYLTTLNQKVKQYYAMKTPHYEGSTKLITKSGTPTHKPLLTQIPNTAPNTTTTQSADYSDFVKGVLVKSADEKSLINVVHSEYNYQKYQHYYQKDINNDTKADLISWDEHNIYIKYADDAVPNGGAHYKKYYNISPSLTRAKQQYEKSNGESFKIYDSNAEVKNFALIGQTFDTLSFEWKHHNTQHHHGYLLKISDRVDSMKEKFNTDKLHYVLLLPKGSSITKKNLNINGKTYTIQQLIDKEILYTVKYYNPSSEKLRFGISELPRAWQYLQIATLGLNQHDYHTNSPRSNQVLGGRQIIADTTPPQGEIMLIRNKKNTIADQGNQLEGYVGSYYDLTIQREDNVQMESAQIYEKDQLLAEQKFDTEKGSISLKNLFFTGAVEKLYTIKARDSEGNMAEDSISLTIKTPGIQIDMIERFSGRKEGILNPLLIHSSIETDIDKGEVHFERTRNKIQKEITALSGGKTMKYFPLTTDQTQVTGAYFDYGELIGMYSQDGKRLGTVNAENGEILIEKAYQKSLHLNVSFEKHYPVIKVMQNDKVLFDVTLSPEKILGIQLKKGELIPLKGNNFGIFNEGYALMLDKKPLLYISPNGDLSSKSNIETTYTFDNKQKAVQYNIKEHSFGEEILTITIKTKPL